MTYKKYLIASYYIIGNRKPTGFYQSNDKYITMVRNDARIFKDAWEAKSTVEQLNKNLKGDEIRTIRWRFIEVKSIGVAKKPADDSQSKLL